MCKLLYSPSTEREKNHISGAAIIVAIGFALAWYFNVLVYYAIIVVILIVFGLCISPKRTCFFLVWYIYILVHVLQAVAFYETKDAEILQQICEDEMEKVKIQQQLEKYFESESTNTYQSYLLPDKDTMAMTEDQLQQQREAMCSDWFDGGNVLEYNVATCSPMTNMASVPTIRLRNVNDQFLSTTIQKPIVENQQL